MASLVEPVDLPLPRPRPAANPAPHKSWAAAWAQPGFRGRLALVAVALLALLAVVPAFFRFIQERPGQQLNDPLLALLPAHDVSALTFAVIYGSIAGALAFLLPRPHLLLRALWGYLFLQLLRMGTLWLLPLDPPAGLVPLHDPVVDQLFQVTTQPVVRDLFFSGHTATAALLTLAVRGRKWRTALACMTAAVGLLVLVQRVHYSCDVVAAPLFAWLAYWLARRVCRN